MQGISELISNPELLTTDDIKNVFLIIFGIFGSVLAIMRVLAANKQSNAAVGQSISAQHQSEIAAQKSYSEIIKTAFDILDKNESPYSPLGLTILNGAAVDKDQYKHIYFGLLSVLKTLASKPRDERSDTENIIVQQLVDFVTHVQSPLGNKNNTDSIDHDLIFALGCETKFENCDFSEIDFTNRTIHHFHFIGCKFHRSNFTNSIFLPSNIDQCDFSESDFQYAKLNIGIVQGVIFAGCNFSYTEISNADFQNCAFERARFVRTKRTFGIKNDALEDGRNVLNFYQCTMDKVEMRFTEMEGIDTYHTTFNEAHIHGCNFTDGDFVCCVFDNLSIINRVVFNKGRLYRCVFTNAHLDDWEIENSDIERSIFIKSHFAYNKGVPTRLKENIQHRSKLIRVEGFSLEDFEEVSMEEAQSRAYRTYRDVGLEDDESSVE